MTSYGAFYAVADNFLHEFENHTENIYISLSKFRG